MPSPFPGMDPYLENPAYWRGFHARFIVALADGLLDRLPPDYDADVDERVRLAEVDPSELEAEAGRDVIPDVSITHRGTRRSPPTNGGTGTAIAELVEPVVIPVIAEREERNRWVRIVHRRDNSLVTVVEVLSPTNENRDGYDAYRVKRDAVLQQHVNLVEIDLLLGGRRMEPASLLPLGDYYAIVGRADRPRERLAYAWPLRHRLPPVHVPLRAPDRDVPLDLAAAFAAAYEGGRYARRLRYDVPTPAPLTEADRAWAEGVARPMYMPPVTGAEAGTETRT